MRKTLSSLIQALLVASAIAALVFMGARLLSKRKGQEPIVDSTQKIAMTEEESATSSFDTDRDGLLDWEEALWGTDPNRPDTDGDGTPDGEEAAQNRDPRKAGPDDAFGTPSVQAARTARGTLFPPLPPPRLGDSTPLLGQEGKATLPLSRERQSSPQLSEAVAESPLRVFGNVVGAFIQTAATDADAELAFWNTAVGDTKMNAELLRGFARLADKYDALAKDIQSVAAPEEAAEAHKELAAAYRGYAAAIRALSQTPAGSHLTAETVTAYGDRTRVLGRAFVAVSDMFYREKVAFRKNEPGGIFMFPR